MKYLLTLVLMLSSIHAIEPNFDMYDVKLLKIQKSYAKYFRRCNRIGSHKCFIKAYDQFHTRRVSLARIYLKMQNPKKTFTRLTKHCMVKEKKFFLAFNDKSTDVFTKTNSCFDKKLHEYFSKIKKH